MAHPVDIHVGQQIRHRRKLLGLTQQKLADAVGIRFQQVQKYESGANRVSASRLWDLSRALNVPVTYFFDQLEKLPSSQKGDMVQPDIMQTKETIDLVRAYYGLAKGPRQQLLALAKALNSAA